MAGRMRQGGKAGRGKRFNQTEGGVGLGGYMLSRPTAPLKRVDAAPQEKLSVAAASILAITIITHITHTHAELLSSLGLQLPGPKMRSFSLPGRGSQSSQQLAGSPQWNMMPARDDRPLRGLVVTCGWRGGGGGTNRQGRQKQAIK